MVPCFPLLGLTPSRLFMGSSSTIIYTSELILCSTICVLSATRHNIHMYPYFLFAAIRHPKSSPTFSVPPCSSVGRVTVDLFRRSIVGSIPTKIKRFSQSDCEIMIRFLLALLSTSPYTRISHRVKNSHRWDEISLFIIH